MTIRLVNRPRTQVGAYLGQHGHKPPRAGKPYGELAPDFCYCPGPSGPADKELVTGDAGVWTVYTGTVGEWGLPKHGASTDFPGNASPGNQGAFVSWPSFNGKMNEEDFTAQVVFQYQNLATSNLSGVFTGGFSVSATDGAWIIHAVSGDIYCLLYDANHNYLYTTPFPCTTNTIYNVVVRKRGLAVDMWVNGVRTTTVYAVVAGMETTTEDPQVGSFYSDHTTNYPWDGQVSIASYWSRSLPDNEVDVLNRDPYTFLKSDDLRFVYTPVTSGGYWGLDYYLKHIAGM